MVCRSQLSEVLLAEGPRYAPVQQCSSINRVLSSSHSSCTLYSSASFGGPTLSSFLHPASLPTFFLFSFVQSASLPPFSPASLPPSCLASTVLFHPTVHPQSSFPADRVELQSKQFVHHFHLISALLH